MSSAESTADAPAAAPATAALAPTDVTHFTPASAIDVGHPTYGRHPYLHGPGAAVAGLTTAALAFPFAAAGLAGAALGAPFYDDYYDPRYYGYRQPVVVAPPPRFPVVVAPPRRRRHHRGW